jgi:hypothetical protein
MGVTTCEACSLELGRPEVSNDREDAEDIATTLGAPKCAACGGMLVRSGKVHKVIGTKQKWETLECQRCARKAMYEVPHEVGCFCTKCLR